MHNLLKFYYNNKYRIWGIIIFIVLILIIIQLLNNLIVTQNNQNLNILTMNTSTSNTIKEQNKNTQIITNQSVVTGTEVNSSSLQNMNNLVEKFISACNNKNLEQAYNLLSDECKNEQYQTLESFKTLYYDEVFNSNVKKIATIENWIFDTYRVYITDDSLSTGKVSEAKKVDYMTMVNENNSLKLNINSFIGTEDINSEKTINNITFNILNKNVYMDYEEYNIQVKNNTGSTILLDTQENPQSIYLQDENNMKYYAYSNELLTGLLRIDNGFSTKISIKFSRSYSSTSKKINSIIFSDIRLKYNETNNNKQILTIEM